MLPPRTGQVRAGSALTVGSEVVLISGSMGPLYEAGALGHRFWLSTLEFHAAGALAGCQYRLKRHVDGTRDPLSPRQVHPARQLAMGWHESVVRAIP